MSSLPAFPLAESGYDYAGISDVSDDVIAVVMARDRRHEISWAWAAEDEYGERDRDPDLAAIYDADGELVGYIDPPVGGFVCEVDVIAAAMAMFASDRVEGQA